jgi:hypothetical protein
MIAALAKRAQVFGDSKYVVAAERAASFILKNMREQSGRLLHHHRDEESAIQGYLDDYAFMVWGLIELYEATFDGGYLLDALELNEIMLEHFWDDVAGGFYFTPDDYKDLPRTKERSIRRRGTLWQLRCYA